MPQITKVWDRDEDSKYLLKKIEFMNDVTDGTAHMREVAKEKLYLPQFPKETPDEYKTRLNITVLEPFTADAIQSSKGKIFSKNIVLNDLPKEFDTYGILDNFDRNGATFEEFAGELSDLQLKDGIAFVYVAFTKTLNDKTIPSKQVRPYARVVSGDRIISKKYRTINGKLHLIQIVISENVSGGEDKYHQEMVQQYRKIYITGTGQITYEVIVNDGGNEKQKETGNITLGGQTDPEIPIVPCYGKKKRYFVGTSHFEELGYLNIEHYQKMSDFNGSFHLAGALTPVITGEKINSNQIKDSAVDEQQQVGGAEIMALEKGGDFKWVGGGADLVAMHSHIEKREERMKRMAFDVVDGGNKTATQIKDEKNDKEAKLKSLAINLENCLNKTLLYMCQYLKIEMGDGNVKVNKDFNLTVIPIEDVNIYKDMVLENVITKETFYKEMQQGERLLTIENNEAEIEKLADGELLEDG